MGASRGHRRFHGSSRGLLGCFWEYQEHFRGSQGVSGALQEISGELLSFSTGF